ncbi:MAG: hypothetical protein ACX98W_09430 [bacterium]
MRGQSANGQGANGPGAVGEAPRRLPERARERFRERVPETVGRALATLPATLFVTFVLLASAGCEQDFLTEGPDARCTEVGAQCVLPDGPLGVCESIACGEGESPPCFVCTPQH